MKFLITNIRYFQLYQQSHNFTAIITIMETSKFKIHDIKNLFVTIYSSSDFKDNFFLRKEITLTEINYLLIFLSPVLSTL